MCICYQVFKKKLYRNNLLKLSIKKYEKRKLFNGEI